MLYELSEEEVKFIKHAMIHSANVYITFYDQGAPEYSYEEAKRIGEETNRIIFDVFKFPNL